MVYYRLKSVFWENLTKKPIISYRLGSAVAQVLQSTLHKEFASEVVVDIKEVC